MCDDNHILVSSLEIATEDPDTPTDKNSQGLHDLYKLAAARLARFERLKSQSDIDEAIEIHKRVEDITATGNHPDASLVLYILGKALIRREAQYDQPADAHLAVSVLRCAIELSPEDVSHEINCRASSGAI